MNKFFFYLLFFFTPYSILAQAPIQNFFDVSPDYYDIGLKVEYQSGRGYVILGAIMLEPGDLLPYILWLDEQGQQIDFKVIEINTSASSLNAPVEFEKVDGTGWVFITGHSIVRINTRGEIIWQTELSSCTDIAVLPNHEGFIVFEGTSPMYRIGSDGQIINEHNIYNLGYSYIKHILLSPIGTTCIVLDWNDRLGNIRIANGQELWSQNIPIPNIGDPAVPGILYYGDLIAGPGGNFILVGTLLKDAPTFFNQYIYVSYWKGTGELIWQKVIPDTENAEGKTGVYLPHQQRIAVAGWGSGEWQLFELNLNGDMLHEERFTSSLPLYEPQLLRISDTYAICGGAYNDDMGTAFLRTAGHGIEMNNGGGNTPEVDRVPIAVRYANDPISSQVNIRLESVSEGEVHLYVYDILGRLMKEEDQVIHIGENDISIDTGDLPKGLFWIHIGGHVNATASFVK